MRIAHIVLKLTLDGIGKLVAALSQSQIDAGHEVAIHTLQSSEHAPDELGDTQIIQSEPGRLPIRVYRMARVFSTLRPDVVHCHNVGPAVVAAPAARFARVPAIVATRHGLGSNDLRAAREFRFWLSAGWWCDAVTGVCEQATARIVETPAAQLHKIVTVTNGANPARRSPAGDMAPPRQGYTLVSVAMLHPVKGHSNLLRAFALARRKSPDLHLWLVGRGPEEDRLKTLAGELGIAEHVVFAGSQQFVGDWLAAADLFVLSSTSEAISLALIEATAAGLPSVVTNVGGMPDVIRACGVGVAVPPQDPAALSEAILQFATRPAVPAGESDSLRECYQTHYTVDAMAAGYEALYKRCAAR